MKPNFSFVRAFARPSHFVPCLVVAGVAVVPAFLAGGCGSSSSSNNTDQFTSIPSTKVVFDIDWPAYASPTPAPSGSPTPTPTPSASPSPTPTPYVESINTAAAGLEAPPNAAYARVTLSTANPNTGSALLLPFIQRVTDGTAYSRQYISKDTAAGVAYSTHYVTYSDSDKARIASTNANVRFYDLYGTPLRDYQAFNLKINEDGTGLNTGLTLVTPSPSATPTATASASPSASPSASASP